MSKKECQEMVDNALQEDDIRPEACAFCDTKVLHDSHFMNEHLSKKHKGKTIEDWFYRITCGEEVIQNHSSNFVNKSETEDQEYNSQIDFVDNPKATGKIKTDHSPILDEVDLSEDEQALRFF